MVLSHFLLLILVSFPSFLFCESLESLNERETKHEALLEKLEDLASTPKKEPEEPLTELAHRLEHVLSSEQAKFRRHQTKQLPENSLKKYIPTEVEMFPPIPWWWMPSQTIRTPSKDTLSTKCLPDTGKYLFQIQKDSGFNNQRQAMIITLLVAKILNRTAVLDRYTISSQHDGDKQNATTLPWDLFLDLSTLCSEVSVIFETEEANYSKQYRHNAATVEIDPISPQSVKRLQEVYGSRDDKALKIGKKAFWGYLSGMFSTLVDPETGEPNGNKELWQFIHRLFGYHFRVQPDIFEWAMLGRAFLLRNSSRYHVAHYRLGDRNGRGATVMNCTEQGMDRGSPDQRNTINLCLLPGTLRTFAATAYITELARKGVIRKDDAFYIATDAPKSPKIARLKSALGNLGVKTFLFSDIYTETSLKRTGEEVGAYVSLIEQVISAYSYLFIGHIPSSWDELVYFLRQWTVIPSPKLSRDRHLEFLLYESMVHNVYKFKAS